MTRLNHLSGVLAVVCTIFLVGMWLRAGKDGNRRRHALAIAMWVLWVANEVWYMWPPVNWEDALPLHVCDIMGALAPLALWTRNRLWMAFAWFVGFGLSSQGLLTPDLSHGFPHPEVLLFWLSHASIVACGVWAVWLDKYRPVGRDYMWVIMSLGLYVSVMAVLNAKTGWNYGYVGPTAPDRPTVLDILGPWPERVGRMAWAVSGALAILLWLPFVCVRKWQQRRTKTDASLCKEHCECR